MQASYHFAVRGIDVTLVLGGNHQHMAVRVEGPDDMKPRTIELSDAELEDLLVIMAFSRRLFADIANGLEANRRELNAQQMDLPF